MKYLATFFLLLAWVSPVMAEKTAADYLAKAEVAFGKKAYKKVITFCDKALDRDPQAADAYYWKGRALEALKKPLEAANEYRAAILARGAYAEAEDGLMRVNLNLGTAQGEKASPEVSNE